jgi:hypothetical protein
MLLQESLSRPYHDEEFSGQIAAALTMLGNPEIASF